TNRPKGGCCPCGGVRGECDRRVGAGSGGRAAARSTECEDSAGGGVPAGGGEGQRHKCAVSTGKPGPGVVLGAGAAHPAGGGGGVRGGSPDVRRVEPESKPAGAVFAPSRGVCRRAHCDCLTAQRANGGGAVGGAEARGGLCARGPGVSAAAT